VADGEDGVVELERGHYTSKQAFLFKGGHFMSLLKPEMVVIEGENST